MHTLSLQEVMPREQAKCFELQHWMPKSPLHPNGTVNYSEDFFGKESNLTVSSQLEAETYAMGLGKVYTLGLLFVQKTPILRVTWPNFGWLNQVAFNDLDDNMDLAEDFIKYVVKYAIDFCEDDLEFLEKDCRKKKIKTTEQAQRDDWGKINVCIGQ